MLPKAAGRDKDTSLQNSCFVMKCLETLFLVYLFKTEFFTPCIPKLEFGKEIGNIGDNRCHDRFL